MFGFGYRRTTMCTFLDVRLTGLTEACIRQVNHVAHRAADASRAVAADLYPLKE